MEKKDNPIVTVFFWLWIILLLPCIPCIPLMAMVFDGGYTLDAYVLFWSIASYPITVLIAGIMRKRLPALVFLPVLNFMVPLAVGLLEGHGYSWSIMNITVGIILPIDAPLYERPH
jgi:hypothetical protein